MKAKARAADATRPAERKPVDKRNATPEANASAARADASDARNDANAVAPDTGLAQWLADLRLPPVDPADPRHGRGQGTADADAADEGTDGVARGRVAGRGNLRNAGGAAADTDAKDETSTRAVFAADATQHREQPAIDVAEPHRAVAEAGAARGEPGTPTAPIGTATFHTAPAANGASSAPLDVALPTPLNAPEFAQALGVQVSVLAKGGVQRAELHLNPAEMGPVSVQIVMDGTQARVEFGADLAHTRQAIEAGIPELASALRDAGLTLSGGGVSEHSRGRGDGADSQPRHGPSRADSGSAAADTPTRASRTRVVAPGGVDLYA